MDSEIQVQIEINGSEYSKLGNANVTGSKITLDLDPSQVGGCARFMEFKDDLNFRESDPGVGIASFDMSDNTITGYLRIAPRTLKPMTISQNMAIVLWILKGEVTLRSTKYKSVNGNNVLAGKILQSGSCISIPPFTPYTLENRSDLSPVVIGYTMTSPPAS